MALARKKRANTETLSLFDIVIPEKDDKIIKLPVAVTPEVPLEEVLPAVLQDMFPAPVQTTPKFNPEEHKKKLIKAFETFRYKHMIGDVFRDFCALSTYSIANSIDFSDEREKAYLEIVKRYSKEEMNLFAEMLGMLTLALEGGPHDILGEVYQALGINSKDRGQFFTPQHVSDMMGMITCTGLEEYIERKGFITMQEPTVGAGSMVFGFCKAMAAQGYNYQQQLHVSTIDLDMRCAHMAYIQMSLLGIPAIVYHGNTLSMEMFSSWVTPMHVIGGWYYKLKKYNEENEQEEQVELRPTGT